MRPYHLIHLCPTVRRWYIKNINIKCLPNMLFKDPGKKANRPDIYSVHCIEPIKGPVHTHQFLFENGYFFAPVWPIVHTYQVKTVTKNGCFQKRSQELRYLETPAFLLRADGRKRRFSVAMTYAMKGMLSYSTSF